MEAAHSSRSTKFSTSDSTLIYREAIPKYGNYKSARILDKTPPKAETSEENFNVIRNYGITSDHAKCEKVDDTETEHLNNLSLSTSMDAKFNNQIVPAKDAKPVNIVDPISSPANVTSLCPHHSDHRHGDMRITSPSFKLDVPVLGENVGVRLISHDQWQDINDKIEILKVTNEEYQSQLERQTQVNTELKKLLVASLGDGLQDRVDKLARDRADLSAEVGLYTKRVTKDHETIDKISIQADMWRSKFLASKMMGDELCKSKALFAMKYQESQNALLGLLNERHELRASLLQSHSTLDQVKDAFDPLRSRTMSLTSTNILDLASYIQHLSQTIKYRLLPPALTTTVSPVIPSALTADRLTRSESFAHDVLSRQVNLSDLNPPSPHAIHRLSPLRPINRFHPDARDDNLTYNCCSKCNGDIIIM